MTQYEMTEKLAEKCEVSLETARNALENSDWNTLTATHLLDTEKFRRMQELNEFAEGGTTAAGGATAAAVQAAPEEAPAQEAPAQEAPAQEAPAQEGGVKIDVVEAVKARKKSRACRGQGLKNLGEHLRRLLALGNRTRFTVKRGDEQLLSMPVTALAILLLCAFWVCVPLLVIGVFAGCRYRLEDRAPEIA